MDKNRENAANVNAIDSSLREKITHYDTVFLRKGYDWYKVNKIKPFVMHGDSLSDYVVVISEIIDSTEMLSFDSIILNNGIVSSTHYKTYKSMTNFKVYQNDSLVFQSMHDSQNPYNRFLNFSYRSNDTCRCHHPVLYSRILYDAYKKTLAVDANYSYFVADSSGELHRGRLGPYDIVFEYYMNDDILVTDYEYFDFKTNSIVRFDEAVPGPNYRVVQSLFHKNGNKYFIVTNSLQSDSIRILVFSNANALLLNVECRSNPTWHEPMQFIGDSSYTVVYNESIDSLLVIPNGDLMRFKWKKLTTKDVVSQKELATWEKNLHPPKSITFYSRDVSVRAVLFVDSSKNSYKAFKLLGIGND
jgi:hypothetical protein